MDEWKAACSRTIILDDSGVVQLFLTNSPDTLYVGLTYEHNNNGDGSGVRLYFDQGDNVPPSLYHGSGDMKLTAPNHTANEQACAIAKSGGSFILQDMCWNGKAWIADGDTQTDFQGASYFLSTSVKVHHSEFAIPLHNNKKFDSTNSDLNVNSIDNLGFYLEVVKTGAGAGTYHWIETNGNVSKPDSFPFWARIQLSVKREYFTFYTGRSSNPPPVIDGSIQESAWNGAYQRELVLSNFHYETYRSKIWCLEDSAQNNIYIGVRVYDKTHNPLDYCQIYFEGNGADSLSMARNYYLDDNSENSARVTNGNQFSDMHWSLSNRGWTIDPVKSDSQTAKAGEASGYTDYEFKIQRKGGLYNINMPKGGLLGFLVRYHDGDMKDSARSNFYWEYTTNNDAQLLENPDIYLATGWTNLQLGGPFIQIVKPASTDSLHGVVPVEVFSGSDSLKSVSCFLSSDTLKVVTLVYQGSGTWKGSIDVGGVSTDNTMLIVRAVSAAGVTYERVVNKVDISPVIPFSIKRPELSLGVSLRAPMSMVPQFDIVVPKTGRISLEVYSASGVKVWKYASENMSAGAHTIRWESKLPVSNGTYLVILKNNAQRVTRKIVLYK